MAHVGVMGVLYLTLTVTPAEPRAEPTPSLGGGALGEDLTGRGPVTDTGEHCLRVLVSRTDGRDVPGEAPDGEEGEGQAICKGHLRAPVDGTILIRGGGGT